MCLLSPVLAGDANVPALRVTSVMPAGQLDRLNRALMELHPQYDPAERMLRRPLESPGYHTTLKGGHVHPTRDSLAYAVALLDTGEAAWLQRAEDILRRVIGLQDQNPESKTYGIWPWFLEEPLDKMSPPDWNWADFCGVQLLQVARDHRQRLPPDLQASLEAAIKHAARSIQRRNVGPGYTNIALMGTYVTLLAAELYGLDDLREYALQRLRNFHAYTLQNGAFTEYNSPPYTVVALKELGRMRHHVQNAEARPLVEEIYRLAWEEIARHFHPPTRQWAGPHSRCYRTLLPSSTLAMIQLATDGRVRFFPGEPPATFDEPRVPVPCPRDLEPFFTRLDGPREFHETFVKGDPPIVGTTYLAPAFAVGSVNRSYLWNQRRALLAYWGSAEKPSYLHLRFLHDGYDFAAAQFFSVQRSGDVLAGINFATNGGDTHPSLDKIKDGAIRARDLRLRLEFGGAAGERAFTAPTRLSEAAELRFDNLRVHLAVGYARLGGLQGRWEAGLDKTNGTAWLDLVLYSGADRQFRLAELEPAALGLAACFSSGNTPSPRLAAKVTEGRLHLALDPARLSLSLPVRPGAEAALQKSFSADSAP